METFPVFLFTTPFFSYAIWFVEKQNIDKQKNTRPDPTEVVMLIFQGIACMFFLCISK